MVLGRNVTPRFQLCAAVVKDGDGGHGMAMAVHEKTATNWQMDSPKNILHTFRKLPWQDPKGHRNSGFSLWCCARVALWKVATAEKDPSLQLLCFCDYIVLESHLEVVRTALLHCAGHR